ncbi:serine/threonine-protein phosphatase 1 regulatory subunit 10 [Drosophila subpulchrella]|uniref:serine/threonine-protein phosphatase 1 regulatory subunit 10 n=1 Tax=Drosophila subpulchrella TaxID=1486046 RepID=UPI0018A1AE4A|nr:serine/threonine-protein phosphatase 1 regulatory subunit 10 [Drosophila subpulchrella]XP_037708409.1 serine/threonine-protein phosphatase 1 regulatory subunit 10 [Drosophila subpulchrella]
MPRIVPLQLLRCLRVLLDNNGGILSAAEVKRISGLMAKYSKKLVSKCVYVQILKSTKTELLGDFMAVGGWSLVYTWLNDAIRAMNWPLVQEILELLLLSPVDVNRLKINSAPILVKGLCKDGGNEGVRILAKRLVEQWLKIVTENTSVMVQPAATQNAATPAPQASAPAASGPGAATVPDSASSSDSTDSAGAPVTYTITSAANSSNSNSITIKWKPVVDKPDGEDDETNSAAAQKVKNDEQQQEDASSATQALADVSLGKKSSLDDSSSAAEVKSGEDVDNKKHKSAKSDKSKRSEKEREKDRKKESSSSHRSSSSSHKSSSSSSSSSSSKSSSSKSSSSSSSSSHRSSSDKYRDKDKARSSSGSSSSSKDRERSSGSSSSSSNKHKSSKSSSSSSSSSSGSSSSKDRKDKSSSSTSSTSSSSKQEKDKDNKLMPPPAVAPANTSPSATAASKESEAQKPRSIPIMSRKASISIEIRRDTEKTATVKTYQSKFRSHGLTEEAPPPPSRKGLKKPTSSTVPAAPALLAIPPPMKRPSPPPRDSPTEKKAKIDMNNIAGHVERPGAAKLIAPKKISTLVETNLFSDALAASIEPKKVVKRKRPASANSPTDKDAPLAPLKFYQDTLDESKGEEKSDDSSKENDDARSASPGKDTDADDDDIPLKRVKEDIEQKVQKEKAAAGGEAGEADNTSENAEDVPEEPKKPGPGCGPDGPPGVLMLHRRKGPKKKLTWQPEDKLTQIRYFEVDRSERVNVMKQTFLEMKNLERFSERDALTIARRGFDDTMEPQMEWRPLIEVDNVPDHPNGNLSKQRQVQMDREATTLRALYFSPDMIPDSAAEAELEPHFAHDIPVIPMDDLTGNPDAVNDYSTLAWPEPKGYAPSTGATNGGSDMGFNDNMMPGLGAGPNMMQNPFDPFMGRMPAPAGMPPAPNLMPNQVPNGPPQIWQNQMGPGIVPQGVPPMMNGPGGPGMDMNNMPPQNFMGNQFGSPVPPFGNGPPAFNQYPPMMMNGPGPGPPGMGPNGPVMGPNGPVMGPNGPVMGPNGPMMNGPPNGPMMNGPPNGMGPGPMQNGGGPRINNNRNKNNGGNWRSGGNNFQDNSGGNWRSAGSGPNRGGGGGGGNTGICKQFMRGHCNMGKNCKYVHPQKKR